ncbi:hypothetical protein [Effusibacillus consociatus]|uniref:hypothetical protein n=1 Tax=Effusibacillus consociatus TaxID=1117041 RepID=UPI0036D2A2A4
MNLVLLAGVVQIGDAGQVSPFVRSSSTALPRGAPSFITRARHLHTATRLHFTDRTDNQANDLNFVGDFMQEP